MSPKPPAITFIYLGINHRWFSGAQYHLGSEYIRAYLASCGITSARLVSGAETSLDQLAQKALDTGAPVYGFTCYDSSYYLNRLLAEKIKEIAPQVRVIFGGPSATFSDRLILKSSHAVDICVRGEGEGTVRDILLAWEEGEDWREISGISFREEQRVVRTPDRPLVGDGTSDPLDFFPSPYLSGLVPADIQSHLGILTSRGCPYPCIYCNFAVMSGRKVRTHSVERVLEDLETIIAGMKDSQRIDFMDDTLTLYPERAKEIFGKIIERGLNRVNYWCETRADKVDEELLLLMKEAGVSQVNFGLESGDPVVLNRCRKLRSADGESDNYAHEREFLEKIRRAVSFAKRIGLNPSLSIILGLPGETRESARKTLDMVKDLAVKTYSHNHLILFAGTELFKNARRYGMRVKKSPSVLPYYTKLDFDPYILPVVENSTTADNTKLAHQERNIHYFQKVTGTPGADDNLAVLFYHTAQIMPADLSWVKKFYPLSAELGWIAPTEVHIQDFIKAVVQAELPCVTPYLLVPGPSGEGQYVWAEYLAHKDYPSSYPVFYMTDLSSVDSAESSVKKNEKAVFLYSLASNAAHARFLELAQDFTEQGVEGLPKPLLEERFSFLDECRWAPSPCPACNLSRVIIHPDRSISPCISGERVGEVGEDIESIKKRLEQYKKGEEKSRGCASCKVRDTCSRCLFPAPVATKEFCELQRNNPGLQKTTKILYSLRAAYLYRTLPRKIFSSIYSGLSPEALEGIKRLAKALALRKTLNRAR